MHSKIIYPTTFHYSFCSPLLFFVFVCFVVVFCVLFLLLFSLYCFNYTLLLLYLISTHLTSNNSRWSIAFIISTLIITTFYWVNYTSLLLHLFITHLVIDFIITMIEKHCLKNVVIFMETISISPLRNSNVVSFFLFSKSVQILKTKYK